MNPYGHVKFGARSEVGLKRQNNEDSFGTFPSHGIWCVADGMGGGDDGEVASAAVVQAVDAFCKTHPMPEAAAYSGRDVANGVIRAVNAASQWIFKRTTQKGLKGCGSTFVGVVIDASNPETAIVLHAGDSRLYRIRGREIRQITKDHSAAELIGAKDEADINPMFRGMILRAVGVRPSVDIEMTPMPVKAGDIVIICSDGLSKMVPDKEIAAVVKKHGGAVGEAIDGLIDAAYAAGATDNVTVELLRFGDLPAAMPTTPMPVEGTSEDEPDTDSGEASTGETYAGPTTLFDSAENSIGGACADITASTPIIFDEAPEAPDGSNPKAGLLKWGLIGAAVLLVVVAVSAATVFVCLNRMAGAPERHGQAAEAPQPPAEAIPPEADPPAAAQVTPGAEAAAHDVATSVPSANAEPSLPQEEAKVPDAAAVKPAETGKPEGVVAKKKGTEELEREALLAKLKATRESAKGEENKAALAGVEYGEAVKTLIEACKGQALADFSAKVGAVCGARAGDRIQMIGRRLAGMKWDDDKVGSASCDLVMEIQKVAETLKSKAIAPNPKRRLTEILGLDPASAGAFRACATLIESSAGRDGR